MLERFECSVCKRMVSMDTDNSLHYTNWNLDQYGTIGKTSAVCSENCKEIAILRHELAKKEMQAVRSAGILDKRDKLIEIREILVNGVPLPIEKLEPVDITNVFFMIMSILEDDN